MVHRTWAVMAGMALFSISSIPICVAAHGSNSRIIPFDVPGADLTPGDFNGTYVQSINDWGVITGYYEDANFVVHGFLRSNEGKYTSFDAPGADTTANSGTGTFATSINDAGVVTGYLFDTSGVPHGFVRSPEGGFVVFDAPGAAGNGTFPIGMNLEGAIVGYYLDSGGLFHAFLRSPGRSFTTWVGPGSCTTNGSLGCYGSAAFSINIFGTVAGGFQDNTVNEVSHGLVRTANGKFTAFEVPGGNTLYGTGCPGCSPGINDFGAIAGIYTDNNYLFHSYLRSPQGNFTPIDVPGAGTEVAQGTGCSSDCPVTINDLGFIAGTYIDANYAFHALLRSPEGALTLIDVPGAGTGAGLGTTCQYVCGLSLNQAGALAGSYTDANNTYHGFLWTP
jgi:hypothetical protein